MTEQMTIGGSEYLIRPVTLADMSMTELMGEDGTLDQQRLMSLSVIVDGNPIDMATLPIGIAIKLSATVMRVCGFTGEDTDEGND